MKEKYVILREHADGIVEYVTGEEGIVKKSIKLTLRRIFAKSAIGDVLRVYPLNPKGKMGDWIIRWEKVSRKS